MSQLRNCLDPLTVEDEVMIENSISFIVKIIIQYGWSSCGLCFNGGKDCTVVASLVAEAKTRIEQSSGMTYPRVVTLFVDSVDNFDEVQQFVNNETEKYSLDLYRTKMEMKEGLGDYLSTYPNIKVVFIGTRRTDPHYSKATSIMVTDKDWPRCIRIHPILDWDYSLIWKYILSRKLKYCSLYDRGYTSLGSTTNTRRNSLLYDKENDEWKPAYYLSDCTAEREGRF